jgi:hypothetical protein
MKQVRGKVLFLSFRNNNLRRVTINNHSNNKIINPDISRKGKMKIAIWI